MVTLLAAGAGIAACSEPADLRVDGAWVRLPAAVGRPGAAYFTVRGGTAPARLLSVTSPVVIRTEIHDSMTMAGGGMATMRPVTAPIPVPAGGSVTFAPGGRHLMLFNVNPGIRPGRAVPLVFTFADGRRLQVSAPAIATGASVPGGE